MRQKDETDHGQRDLQEEVQRHTCDVDVEHRKRSVTGVPPWVNQSRI